MSNKLNVAWFSAGVDSTIAIYLSLEEIDKIIYIHIDDQHEDTMRYVKDCEKLFGKPIEILQSRYKTVDEVQQAFQFVASAWGAKCTEVLKKRVRKEWELDHKDYDITYYWGFDSSERIRAEKTEQSMDKYKHKFPLIEKVLTKQDCHAMLKKLGIKRPLMYDLGYSNNNCIGCVKGGIGYWNKIRVDFPDRFKQQAERERQVGHTCLKDKNGPIYLDELDPNRGNMEEEIMEDCSIICQIVSGEREI